MARHPLRAARRGPGSARRFASAALLAAAAIGTLGCKPPAAAPAPVVKSVKTVKVEARSGDRVAHFSGRVAAAETAVLSFPMPGTVEAVTVRPGDKVRRGQVLARLDVRPLQLELDAATADLRKAESGLTQRSNTLARNRDLFRKGFIGEAAIEQSEADVAAARSDVAYRHSRREKAELTLADTRMAAPFAGVIGEQFVHANEEVGAGSRIVSLLGEDQLQVEVSVPETAIARVRPGMPARVTFDALPGQDFDGTVREIGRLAGAGNVYPVKVALPRTPERLRSGMAAEVALAYPGESGEPEGFLVPVSALRPGEAKGQGHVFVVDPQRGAARMVPVEVLSVRDNDAVLKGLQPGQQVIVAGVSFLTEGQPVKLMADGAR
ncbi:MAG: efflux RND transporter periplasmic adaptor subunit [Piscinibacter sp.]|nr:efflux RND transporter periplasmic adaptor subunit [Piscinibacter sp.]